MQKQTQTIALGGVFGALSLLALLAGDLMPLSIYLAPILAGLLLLPVAHAAGQKAGWLAWATITLLGLLMVPNREVSILFAAFLGYYPLLKFKLDTLRPGLLRWLVKLALFNGTVLAAYWVMLKLLRLPALTEEFAGMGLAATAALLALANLAFILYDIAAGRLYRVYVTVLYPRISKGRH